MPNTRTTNQLRPFDKRLPAHSMPAAILQKSRQLKLLSDDLSRFIPEPLANHCQLANLQNRVLTFVVSNAQWAMQLRAIETPLLQAATELSSRQIEQLNITVNASWKPTTQLATEHSLSNVAADHLLSTANHLEDNPELQAALRKLAQHAKPVSK